MKEHVDEADQEITGRLKQTILLCVASIIILLATWPGVLMQFRRHLRRREESELALRNALLAKEQEDWFKTGQAELNEVTRGEEELVSLSNNIITQLANYLNAQIGALYLVEDGDVLTLSASYAYYKRKHISHEFAFGEGLVGQAALEGKTIVVAEGLADYIVVQSGLGESRPSSIVIVPFVFEGKTSGVIVLGSFQEFSREHVSFLEKVAENIAIIINSAESRRQVASLLQETQAQSEELQTQQEALRASNEELEEQAASLQRSEGSLRRQQEEMETINAELEEKTGSLEKQKVELLRAQDVIEAKAEELEVTSRYKSEFLSNMSHELRTPLNSLLILAKMLANNQQGNLTKDQVKSARVICDGGTDLLYGSCLNLSLV